MIMSQYIHAVHIHTESFLTGQHMIMLQDTTSKAGEQPHAADCCYLQPSLRGESVASDQFKPVCIWVLVFCLSDRTATMATYTHAKV